MKSMTVGDKIRQKRQEYGMSQEQLANLLDVNLKTVYRWEKNETLPRFDMIKKIAEIFDCSPGWFLTDKWIEEDGTLPDIDPAIFTIPPDILEAVKNPKMQKAVRALRPIIEGDD